LWYTPILPILFLVSAVAVGPAMVIFESTLSTRVFGHKLEIDVLSGLAKAIPYILGLYLLLKIVELMAAGEIGRQAHRGQARRRARGGRSRGCPLR